MMMTDLLRFKLDFMSPGDLFIFYNFVLKTSSKTTSKEYCWTIREELVGDEMGNSVNCRNRLKSNLERKIRMFNFPLHIFVFFTQRFRGINKVLISHK